MTPTRLSRPPTLKRAIWLVACVVSALGTAKLLYATYYEERDRLQSLLNGVDGIADVQILGCDDMTYEVHAARFSIVDRPEAVIVLDEPTRGLTDGSGRIAIRRLGPWEFHTASYGHIGAVKTKTREPVESLGYSSGVDVGPFGEFADRLPVKIRKLQDLVDHYDVLVKFFETWPDDRNWAVVPGSSDPLRVYCRTSVDQSRPLASPSQFPVKW